MKRNLTIAAFTLLLVTSTYAADPVGTEAAGYLAKAYPQAEKGLTRVAIILPKLEHEENVKVELIVGKKAMADSVNHFSFGGKIETVNIEGWGFDRYVVKEMGAMMGTLIGGGVPQEKFVEMQPILIRYNSRLPIVVYVPEGAEVRYRLWTTTPESKEIPKG